MHPPLSQFPGQPVPSSLPDPADSQPPEDESTSRRGMDPELRCMGAMLRLLDDLPDQQAKGRVVGWLYFRFTSDTGRK